MGAQYPGRGAPGLLRWLDPDRFRFAVAGWLGGVGFAALVFGGFALRLVVVDLCRFHLGGVGLSSIGLGGVGLGSVGLGSVGLGGVGLGGVGLGRLFAARPAPLAQPLQIGRAHV